MSPCRRSQRVGAVADNRAVDLLAERALAILAMTGARLRFLDAIDCARGFILGGGIGEGRVQFQKDGTYQPTDNGVEALLIGCWRDRPGVSELVDIAAVAIGGAERWGTRCGRAFALGLSTIEIFPGAIVSIHGSPWAWLRTGASGVWILEPEAPEVGDLLLSFARTRIHAEDIVFGRQLQQAQLRSLPKIMVPDDK